MPGWLEQIKDQHDWRQMDHIFAKRCEKKNPTYVPKDFTKEDEIYAKGKANEIEEGQKNKDRNLKRQIDKKRQVMTCKEEEKMLEQAFEKGVIRIETSELLNWHTAKKIADEFAGGLCTLEDLKKAEVKYPESFDHAAYALHKNGGVDGIQLGSDPRAGEEQLTSIVDRHNNAQCYCDKRDQAEYKQMDHIFAKRCEKKNPTYIPKDFTKENKIWEEYKIEKAFEEKAGKQGRIRHKFHNIEQQNEMLKNAFDNNIIRIETENKCLNYEQAKILAHEKALRLPTLEELKNSGVIESDELDIFAFVQRPDNKPDAIQLGEGHETVKSRFWS